MEPTNRTNLILAAFKHHIKNRAHRITPISLSKRFDASPNTIREWLKSPHRMKAHAMQTLLAEHGMEGLTFEHKPLPDQIEPRHIIDMLLADTLGQGHKATIVAQAIGTTDQTIYLYTRVPDHMTRNLTFTQLEKWAYLVGWGEMSCHVTQYGEYGEKETVGLHCEWQPERKPAAARDQYQANVGFSGVTKIITNNECLSPGLHLPLRGLLKVLKAERLALEAQGAFKDKTIAGIDVKQIEMWETGRILHSGRGAAFDLTLSDLSVWGAALGFGALCSPRLGYDFGAAIEDIVRMVKFEDTWLTQKRARRVVGQRTYHEMSADDFNVDSLAAGVFEVLCVWAYGDGLGFEHNTGRSGKVYPALTRDKADQFYLKRGDEIRRHYRFLNDKATYSLRDNVHQYGYNPDAVKVVP